MYEVVIKVRCKSPKNLVIVRRKIENLAPREFQVKGIEINKEGETHITITGVCEEPRIVRYFIGVIKGIKQVISVSIEPDDALFIPY